MTQPTTPGRPPQRHAAPTFAPRFTLSLVYLVVFFFLYAFILILPALLGILEQVAPGPEQQAAAEKAARAVIQPKLGLAFGLAIVTTAVGGYYGVLPGIRS